MKFALIAVTALTLAACGTNATQRGLSGAATGAVAAGPVGAVVGGALGATGTVKVR